MTLRGQKTPKTQKWPQLIQRYKHKDGRMVASLITENVTEKYGELIKRAVASAADLEYNQEVDETSQQRAQWLVCRMTRRPRFMANQDRIESNRICL